MAEIFTHDLMAYDGIKILQKENTFRFSLDSLLLGDFITIKPRDRMLLELGCGNGAILLYLSLKTKIKLMGVEIQKEVVELAKASVSLNHLDNQIEIFHQDIKNLHNFFQPSSFDILVSNPPFFKVDGDLMINESEFLSLSRHEVAITFAEILDQAKKLLKTNGSFFFIHRAARFEEIILALAAKKFVIKKLRFVYTKPKNEALMILVEAKYNGKTGSMKIMEPLYIYNQENQYTDETLKIFHLGDEAYDQK